MRVGGEWKPLGLLLAALWVGTAWPLAAAAANPQLSRAVPSGGQRGTSIEVVLAGSRLSDPAEVLFYQPGIHVERLEATKGGVKCRFVLAANCPLGLHDLRLRTATGLSNLITFSVGNLPEKKEAEPNSDFAKPQAVALGTVINGVVDNEDVDYYLVTAKKGQRITAEIEGVRLGHTFFDPSLSILDSQRFVLAAADDMPLVRQDAVVATLAPRDGDYLIQVRESAWGGSSASDYRLHLGEYPRPLAVFPAGGRPGESLAVRWIGDPASPWIEKIRLPGTPRTDFGLFARDSKGEAPLPNPFRLSELEATAESEPNDTSAQANRFEAPGALDGVIEQAGDADYYRFTAKKGEEYDIRVFARQLRTPLDPVLTITRQSGASVGSNDDSETPDSYLRFRAPGDDEYLLRVIDQLGKGGAEYVYRVELSRVEPGLVLGLVEPQEFYDAVAPVPQGGHYAVMVSAQRSDFGGEVSLALKGLPPGVKAELGSIVEDETMVPLMLHADAGAKLAGALVDIVGRWSDAKASIEGRLRQRTSLVRGQNNREVWNRYTDRMALAVTKPVPFALEVVPPKAPLVQEGSMELKVRARRQPGFDGPINVRMLYNPAGVSSSTANLPAGKADTVIPLTANASAKPKLWQIAVMGEASIGDGPVTVASPLAALEVSPPLFRLSFPTVSVEQGKESEVVVEVQKLKDFAGSAQLELVGLPNEVTSEPQSITAASTEIRFPLRTTAKSPVGNHKVLRCRGVATISGEPVVHLQGTGELRILKPVVPKAAPAKPLPGKATPAKTEQKAAAKPLSRLEQLRQEKGN